MCLSGSIKMANSENTDQTIHQEQSYLGLLFAKAL